MTNLKYRLFDPTGNVTALVESFVEIENQPQVAEYILSKEPSCEQVGYLYAGMDGSHITLRMAGGEFCGNATMSTAVYYASHLNMEDGNEVVINVKVIGTEGLIAVTVRYEDGNYYGTIKMPKVLKISEEILPFEGHVYKYPVVTFSGISHIVVEENIPIYMAEAAIKVWLDRLKVKGLGLMLVDKEYTKLTPLVYVINPDTLCWESSCASGTTAVGAYYQHIKGGDIELTLKEPGGKLKVKATQSGDIYLSGIVRF